MPRLRLEAVRLHAQLLELLDLGGRWTVSDLTTRFAPTPNCRIRRALQELVRVGDVRAERGQITRLIKSKSGKYQGQTSMTYFYFSADPPEEPTP